MGEEMGHQFGVRVDYMRDGECSDGLRGRQSAHWSFWVDTDGSVMEGNKWQDQADGTFLSLLPAGGYADMDLYLWGFIPPEEVSPFFLIDDPEVRNITQRSEEEADKEREVSEWRREVERELANVHQALPLLVVEESSQGLCGLHERIAS